MVEWGRCRRPLGGCSFLSAGKSPTPSSTCLGSWTIASGGIGPGEQVRMGTEASSLPMTSDNVLSNPALPPTLLV